MDQVDLYTPNENFFSKYGSLEEDDSIISSSSFLFVRHGISLYNIAIEEARKIKDLGAKCSKINEIKTSLKYIDPLLTE